MTKPCWICSDPAETREHKFKKTDVDRAGGGWTPGERPHFFGANGVSVIRGPDSKLVKFDKVLCQNCNSARTQRYDNAYDRFSECVNASGRDMMSVDSLDFEAIYGAAWHGDVLCLLKYFLKHFGCVLSDWGYTIPLDLADLFDRDDLSPFFVSFARNGEWFGIERGGNGPFGNFPMLGMLSQSTGLVHAPYISGTFIGCIDIVYGYGDLGSYGWEGRRISAPCKSVGLGRYDQDAGQPHLVAGFMPRAWEFTIGDKRYFAPSLSAEQRVKISAMPVPSPEKSFAENLDACLDVVAALMEMCFGEADRGFLENNLTLPEAEGILRAFHLIR